MPPSANDRLTPMRTLLLLLLAGMAANAGNSSLAAEVLGNERQELDCLKTCDYDQFASFPAANAVCVDRHVNNTRNVRLSDYTMEEVKFIPLSATSGMIVYKLTERGISHGKDFSAKVNVSALWINHKGKWVCIFSQETGAR